MSAKWTPPPTTTAAAMLSGEPPESEDFAVGALPVGELGLLVGSDGSGKSDLALQMALAVVIGRPIAGGALPPPEKSGDILYVGGEDDGKHIHRKLISLGGETRTGLCDFHISSLNGEHLTLLEAGRQAARPHECAAAVDWLIAEAQGTRLIIIDPLVMFHSVSEVDNGHLDALARLLIRIARRSGAAILAVHHTGQAALIDSRNDHQAGRGGTALAAASRCVYTLRRLNKEEKTTARKARRNPDKLRYLRGSKTSRTSEPPEVLLEFTATGTLVLAAPLDAPQTTAASYARLSHPGYKEVNNVCPF